MSAVHLKKEDPVKAPLLSGEEKAVFLQETLDLFKHRRQGHLIHRMYLTKDALYYWSEFMKHRDYYVTRSEVNLISMFSRVIGNMARHADGIVGIENGPGTQSAMKKKSSVFFSAMPDLHTYVGRDWSSEIMRNIQKFMPLELFNADIIADHANFLEEDIPANLKAGRKVMAEFGLTQGNIEGFPHDPFPEYRLYEDMVFHRRQLNADDLYVVTFDANQNEKSITQAYTSNWLTLWGRELLRTMKAELSIEGDFDPESFVFIPIWHAGSYINTNNMVPTRTMKFKIGGIEVTAHEGEPFGITNSYKTPVELFAKIARNAGFEMSSCFPDPEKRIMLAVFKAIQL